jgi:RHS repeat-associated protein
MKLNFSHNQHSSMKKFSVLLILIGVFSTYTLRAQHITGTTSCTLGSTYTYTFNDGTTSYVNPIWSTPGGVVVSSSHTSGSAIWTANVQWSFAGGNSVAFSAFGSQKGFLSVSVSCPSPPSVPTNGSGGAVCPGQSVTISASPGSGANSIRWWSASSGGSLLATGTTYNTGAGTFYAQSYNSSNGCVSSSRLAVTVFSNSNPNPPAVVSAGSGCPGTAIALTGSTTSTGGGIVEWYSDNTSGSHTNSLAGGDTYSPTLTSTTTFYMGTYNPSTGCDTSPSARTAITGTVFAAPPTPNPPPITTTTSCGPQTLSYGGSPPAGVSWYWQGQASGGHDDTQPANWNPTYNATSSGTYYLAAKSNGCWNVTNASVNVTVHPNPAVPGNFVPPSNQCGPKVISYDQGPPAGITWYWQTDDNSLLMNNSSPTLTFTTSTSLATAYARAYNPGTGCWSAVTHAYVTVDNPPTPNPITVTQNLCGNKTLSFNGPSLTDYTLYWESTSSDQSVANSASPYSISASGTYYAAGKSGGGCWSQTYQSTGFVTVNPYPTAPIITATSNACGPKTLSYTNSPSGGSSFYWEGTTPNTDHTSGIATAATYTASTSGSITYYAGAMSTAGCWSYGNTTRTVDNPPAPNPPTQSANACGDKILTLNGPSGFSLYWETSTSDQSLSNPGPTKTFSSSGTYFIGLKSSGNCWTYNTGPVTVNPIPAAPGISVPTNCGSKILSYLAPPPSGVGYYWQGKIQNQHDYTSATATAATYTVTAPAGNTTDTYYAGARSSAGCWNTTDTPASVTTHNPAAVTSQGAVPNVCESDPPQQWSVFVAPGDGTAKWTPPSPGTPVNATSYSPGWLNPGTYNYTVTHVDAFGCESSPQTYSVVVKTNCDDYYNWRENIKYTYDATGANQSTISQARVYSDAFGSTLQSQVKSFTNNNVLATEKIFDGLGRPVVTTLAAPTNQSSFAYRYRFTTTAAPSATPLAKYAPGDFDLPVNTGAAGEINNPYAVGNNGVGSLGWYYSSSNNLEPNAPRTTFPYMRTYSPAGPNQVTSRSTKPGDPFRMGNNHEAQADRSLLTASDLSNYYAIRSTYNYNSISGTPSGAPGYKIISTDADHRRSATFVDADGRVLATARVASVNNGPPVSYTYDNWTYNFYNPLGQLVAIVAPKGVPSGVAQPTYVTTYKYDQAGRISEINSPDEGITQYLYSTDGKLRFSQNAEQRLWSRFSYTNYDSLGRPIESGEYTKSTGSDFVFEPSSTASPQIKSVLLLLDNLNYTGVTRAGADTHYSDVTFIDYDFQTSDFVAVGTRTTPHNLVGRIARTMNDYSTTWYSYDEFGHTEWTIQNIVGLGSKTTDYTYDFVGNVTKIAYQDISGPPSDRFFHHYTYDLDNRLSTVSTSIDGTSTVLRAKYYYYLHGPLKRMELMNGATKVQGVDYVYNIDGSLKSINHSDASATDPGQDGGTNGFPADAFGMVLDYYTGDYTGAATVGSMNTGTYGADSYAGLIKAQRWHSALDGHTQKAYVYSYDNVNRITSSDWGSVTGTYTFNATTPFKEAITYQDQNGNIQTLTRNDKNSTASTYTYNLVAGTNRLQSVTGGATVNYDYTAAGQVKQQTEGSKTMNITYNAYGRTKDVKDASGNLVEQFFYDDRGGLAKKVSYDTDHSYKTTYYVRNAVGSETSVYESYNNTSGVALIEEPIYGMGRIGMMRPNEVNVKKYYSEITDHLGNVRAVIADPATWTDQPLATYETANASQEEAYYLRMEDAKRVASYLFDHTGDANAATITYQTDFSTGLGNFTANGTITLSLNSGRLMASGASSSNQVITSISTVAGHSYRVTCDIDLNAFPDITLFAIDPLTLVMPIHMSTAGNGTYVLAFTAPQNNVQVVFQNGASASRTFYLDNFKVEDISGGGAYAERVSGGTNEKYGIARSIGVMPGDVVNMEVYAKYVDASNSSNWPAALSGIMAMVGSHVTGVVGDGADFAYSTSSFPYAGLQTFPDNGVAPKAYLAWLIFDGDFNFTGFGSHQITTAAKENGSNTSHELLSGSFTATQPGYVYVYLVNNETSPVDVYFDDLKVTQTHNNNFVAGGDYYPFGMPIGTRHSTVESYRFGYQGQSSEADPANAFNNFDTRTYDPRFARWLSPDPGRQFWSSYVGMGNAPSVYVNGDNGAQISVGPYAGAGAGTGLAASGQFSVYSPHTWKKSVVGTSAGQVIPSIPATAGVWWANAITGALSNTGKLSDAKKGLQESSSYIDATVNDVATPLSREN